MLGPAAIMVADGVEDAVARNGGQKLLNVQSQQDGADSSEDEVVDQEQTLELERLTTTHQLATAEDDGVVDDDEDGGGLEGGHGRLEGDETKVLGRVADTSSPCLIEDGPQVNAEGTIERRQRKLLVEGGGSSGSHYEDNASRGMSSILEFVLVWFGVNQKGKANSVQNKMLTQRA